MAKPGDLRVWWIPQVPMKSFYVEVATVAEGVKILDTLAAYDMFQYDNNIKPDYANAGGLDVWVTDAGEGIPDWEDWYDEGSCTDDPREYLANQIQQS